MRRNLFAWISVAGVLIQLAVCTSAVAANLKTSTTTKTKYRITGVVKDALGRPIKHAALSLQGSNGQVVAHASSNDAGEFSFNVDRARAPMRSWRPAMGSRRRLRSWRSRPRALRRWWLRWRRRRRSASRSRRRGWTRRATRCRPTPAAANTRSRSRRSSNCRRARIRL